MDKNEFKKRVSAENKEGRIHIRILSKELGDAIDEQRTRVEWFPDSTKFAEVTVGDEKVRVAAKGGLRGQLLDANGNVLSEFNGMAVPLTEPVELLNDEELQKYLGGLDENYYIDFEEENSSKLYAVSSNGKTVPIPHSDVVEAVLDTSFFVSHFGAKAAPEEKKEEPEEAAPEPEAPKPESPKTAEVSDAAPDAETPAEQKPETAEQTEAEAPKPEASKPEPKAPKKKTAKARKKPESESEEINYEVLPLGIMNWFLTGTEHGKDAEFLNMLSDDGETLSSDPAVIAATALQIEQSLFENSADMLLAYAEEKEKNPKKETSNDMIYHFLKSLSSDLPDEEKAQHRKAILWSLLDQLEGCSSADL